MRGLKFLGNSKIEMTYLPPGGYPGGGNPGHEVMGIVEDPNGSRRFHKGDRVGVVPIQGCGECFWCRQGKQDFCRNIKPIRTGHSEYVVGKEIWMQPVPDDIDDGVAALLAGDGMGVPYGASIRSGVAAGDITCIFGSGPVGGAMTIVQAFLGARVIAIDIRPEALERAAMWGAWKTIHAKETKDIKAAILDMTDGLGPNKSYDACGNQEMFNLGLEVTMPGGTVMGDWSCHFSAFTDQVAMIRNGLPISRLITATYPLEQYEEAYRRFMAGQEGKVILVH